MHQVEKLLQLSNKRKISDKQFINLFEQLYHQQPVSSGEFQNLLEDASNETYLVLIAVKHCQLFWESIETLPINQQIRLLKRCQSKLTMIKDMDRFIPYFIHYSNVVLKENNEILINELIFNWEIIINNFNVQDLDIFKSFMHKLSLFLNANNYSKQLDYCNNKFKSIFASNKIKLPTKLNNLTLNGKLKNYHNYENLKIFYWFNQWFKTFEIPNNEVIFHQFNTNFNGDGYKLIYSIFNGINYCLIAKSTPKYIVDNWINFLNSRLPKLIQMYKIDNLDDILFKIFESFNDGALPEFKHLKQSFIKSLIFNKFLSIKSFHKFFPNEIKINQQNLIHEMSSINSLENFNDILKDKLYNINCEFISMEESGLIDIFNSTLNKIEFSMVKQLEMVKLLENFLNLLINELNFEKLNRLVLLILSNDKLFHLFLFNLSSKDIILNLIKLVDNDSFKINDDNENSFQEYYSYFGNLLLFLIKISKFINLGYKTKNSFFNNYLKNFNLNYANLTLGLNEINNDNTNINISENGNNKIIIETYSNLMNDWIQSLFNESEGGLSDDIMKSIDIKQIHQVIPIIYQHAILALVEGKIDDKIFNNGLDYLSQNFLLTCNLSIINWLILKINLKNSNLNKYLEILIEMIKLIEKISNESNNEIKLTSEILLNMAYESIYSIKDLNIDNQFLSSRIEKFEPNHPLTSITNNKLINSEILTFENFEDNIIKILNGTLNETNLNLINYYLFYNKSLINSLIFNLNSSNFKSNNENLKYLIDFLIFVTLTESIKSSDSKKFWIKKLTNPKLVKKLYSSDLSFKFSMDNHYSSIFNDHNDNYNDDELFETISIDYSIKESDKYSLGLIEFFRIYCQFINSDNESLVKSLNMIHGKLLNELKQLNI